MNRRFVFFFDWWSWRIFTKCRYICLLLSTFSKKSFWRRINFFIDFFVPTFVAPRRSIRETQCLPRSSPASWQTTIDPKQETADRTAEIITQTPSNPRIKLRTIKLWSNLPRSSSENETPRPRTKPSDPRLLSNFMPGVFKWNGKRGFWSALGYVYNRVSMLDRMKKLRRQRHEISIVTAKLIFGRPDLVNTSLRVVSFVSQL